MSLVEERMAKKSSTPTGKGRSRVVTPASASEDTSNPETVSEEDSESDADVSFIQSRIDLEQSLIRVLPLREIDREDLCKSFGLTLYDSPLRPAWRVYELDLLSHDTPVHLHDCGGEGDCLFR